MIYIAAGGGATTHWHVCGADARPRKGGQPIPMLPSSSSHSSVIHSMIAGGDPASWPANYGVNGGNNLYQRPRFADFTAQDYHLVCGTPGVDAGNNALNYRGTAKDLAGNNRIINNRIDMGAYETLPAPPTARPVRSASGRTLTYNNTATADSVRWTFGNGAYSTQNAGTYTYAGNGTYRVCLHIVNSCGTADSCMNITVSGTDVSGPAGPMAKEVQICPNPAAALLYIKGWKGGYRLYSTTGALMLHGALTGAEQRIDLAGIPAGSYLIEVKSNDQQAHRERIIKL